MQSSVDKVNEQLKALAALLQEYPLGSALYNQAWIARQALLYAQNPDQWTPPTECLAVVKG
jgi:hypothetical protein